ncbi:lipoprotein [Streptomyces sp. NPDC004838]
MRGAVPVALAVGVLGGLLSGCSSETEPEPDKAASAGQTGGGEGSGTPKAGDTAGTPEAKNAAEPPAAAKGGSVGGKGTPCELPVTFDLAADWRPEAVKAQGEAALPAMGPVRLVCEIDAKPAGNIGFLRVWTGGAKGDDPRKALEAFLTAYVESSEDVVYTGAKAGEYQAAEVTYVEKNELLDEKKRARALAFTTPKGIVLFDLGGLDSAEHDQMLPAYALAKKSVRAV